MDKKLITVHLIDPGGKYGAGSLCQKAVIGDKAITLAQAEDTANRLTFNCKECYYVWRGEYPVEQQS